LSSKKSNKAYSCAYKSPIGNIRVKFSGSPLTLNEYNILKRIIVRTENYDTNSSIYSNRSHKVQNPLRLDPLSEFQGLIIRFSLSELQRNQSSFKYGKIDEKLLSASIDKFMLMLIEIWINGRLRVFRPINEFTFTDDKYSIHVQELFVFWTSEQTTWREVDRCFGGGNKPALSLKSQFKDQRK